MTVSDYNLRRFAQNLGIPRDDMSDIITNGGSSLSQSNVALSGSFFSSNTVPASISRLGDRVFVGTAVEQDGSNAPNPRTWVGLEANGYLTYFDTRSTMENISTIGGVSFAGATRVSDNPAGMTNVSIVYAGLAKNDVLSANTSDRKAAWSFYGLAVREPDEDDAVAGATQVAEFHIINRGGVVDTNPYASLSMTSGVTYGAIFGSGGEYSESGIACNSASAAIHMAAGNGVKFRKGINISAGALDGANGSSGTGDAVTMALGHQLVWFYSGSEDARGLTIRSDCNTLDYATKMVASTTGLRFLDQFDNTIVRFLQDTTMVEGDGYNYCIMRNIKGGTGNPSIQATGTDGSIGVDLVGQFRAQFNFYNMARVRLLARVADVGSLTTNSSNILVLNANDGTADPYVGVAGTGTNINVGTQGKGTGGLIVKDGGAAVKFQVNTTGVGFFAATPVAKQTLPAALSTGGSASNTDIATAINAIRTALINYGLAT